MLAGVFKSWARRLAEPLAMGLAKLGVTPNILTVVGFGLNLIVAAILALGHVQIGGVLLLIVSAFDMLDGTLARSTNQVTKFGAFLDSTLDRYSEGAIYAGLLVALSNRSDTLGIVLVVIALIGSLMVSYTRARAEGVGISCEVGLLARPERIIVLGVGLLLDQPVLALAIVAALANFTAAQRVMHVWQVTKGR